MKEKEKTRRQLLEVDDLKLARAVLSLSLLLCGLILSMRFIF